MHGRGGGGGEKGRRSWHMWPVPDTPGAAAAVPPVSPRPVIAPNAHPDRFANGFFLKDGRKIHIGDCALFQSGNSPAFIGLIRSLSSFKEGFPKLIVNWLYRPADIKLAKGILLEAAPNEVFYSFHKDEISAESLLHPCKVAFLRRGVKLPSGISSFVCRRVYDIANKCLWWLTDQDYINERQEEVDQLLDKTQIEMHAAVQSGGRSLKQLNGSAPMQQLKSSPDSIQNSSSFGQVHMKGKRRDKVEQNLEAIKRENATKADEGDSGNSVLDGLIRDEVTKITNKGGLVDVTGVDKLINLMQIDKDDRKIDLAGRMLLADVIANTSADRFDCLGRFVEQKGLRVLDDWLQEAHKGKVGDGNSPREGDKSFEELVLTLLRALDKLPVNLHALQTSNIGKSVNNLRSLKNLEIQKKARILVDTWKKRVDAEIMKSNDAKFVGSSQSVSWSGKPSMTEAAHGVSRRMGDAISRNSSLSSSTFKNLPVKHSHGDAVSKSVTALPGSKSTMPVTYPGATCTKDALPKVAVTSSSADLQCTPVKEEKSSGSSQSQSNNQSSVTGPGRTMTASRKDDARSSNSGSLSGSKISGGVSRHRKSSNILSGAVISGMQKESSFNKASTGNRTPASNKTSLLATTCEQVPDHPPSDHGNGHRLIVRLPNPGKSPARSTSGGSIEELPVVGSRASSPCVSEKHDQSDLRVTIEGEACQANDVAEPNREPSNEKKGAVASSEGAHLQTALCKGSDENGKAEDSLKDDNTLPTSKKGLSFSELKSRNQYNPSLCSMNALIESCVKSPETCVSLSAGDDLGMNLLASVATEEMLRSELVCSEPSVRSLPVLDNVACTKGDRLNLPHDIVTQGSSQHERMDAGTENTVDAGNFKKESQKAGITVYDDKTNVLMLQEHKVTGGNKTYAQKDNKSENRTVIKQPMSISQDHEVSQVNTDDQMHESHNEGVQTIGGLLDDTHKVRSPLEENRDSFCSRDKGTTASRTEPSSLANARPTAQGLSSNEKAIEDAHSRHMDMHVDKTGSMNPNSVVTVTVEQQSPHLAGNNIGIPNKAGEFSTSCGTRSSENDDPLKSEKADCADKSKTEPSENEKELPGAMPPTPGQLCSISVASGNDGGADDLRKKDAPEDASSGSVSHEDLARSTSKEGEQCKEPASSNTVPELKRTGDQKAPSETSHVALNSAVDVASKLDFDLNKGISADEVSQGEVANVCTLPCSTVACQPLASNSISTISRGYPVTVTVTVAAPVKGPFMPPENLSRSKDEPGWKGSAATSAFRPAEPRKTLEMPMGRSVTPYGGKQNRPSLDIDLNVADARIMEDTVTHCPADRTGPESCSASPHEEVVRNVGLGLDLNKADESLDGAQNVTSTSRRWVPSHCSEIPAAGFPNGETSHPRDFDLNDGPGAEATSESVLQNQQTKSSVLQFLPTVSSLRMNSAESGNLSSWFPSGTTYPPVAISPFFSDRGDSTYPMVAPNGAARFLGSSTVGSSFGGDNYRGPVLSSSPAMAFTAANPFTHAGFQFPSGFPLSSNSFAGVSTAYADPTSRGACLPTLHSPLVVGPANATSSPYIRPYVISLSDSSASGGGSEGARKWGGQNLDLNAGPGGLDVEARAERLTSSSHHMSLASQPMFTEEAGRIYQVSGGGFKRKEPEGGWDTERFSYKQSPWQ